MTETPRTPDIRYDPEQGGRVEGVRERPSHSRLIALVVVLVIGGLVTASLLQYAPWEQAGGEAAEPAAQSAESAGAATESPVADTAPPAATASTGGPLPASLAGMGLARHVDGPEAIVQTEGLHGKGLGRGLDEAWIGQYGGGEITLWISRSYEEQDAADLMTRMTASIERSETPFTGLEAMDRPTGTVYGLDGMGQRHFYFRLGRDLYWLAAPPALADGALEELLAATGDTTDASAS